MHIGMVGMGRMGGSMAQRLHEGGHRVVAYDRDPDTRAAAGKRGLDVAESLEQLVETLANPRVVWVMVPSGNPTEGTVSALAEVLETGTSSSRAATPTTTTRCDAERSCSTAAST